MTLIWLGKSMLDTRKTVKLNLGGNGAQVELKIFFSGIPRGDIFLEVIS